MITQMPFLTDVDCSDCYKLLVIKALVNNINLKKWWQRRKLGERNLISQKSHLFL